MNINREFWEDEFFLNLNQQEKLFYLYIFSFSNELGCFSLTQRKMARDLMTSVSNIKNLIKKFEFKNVCFYDSITNEVLINKYWFLPYFDKKEVNKIKQQFLKVKSIYFQKILLNKIREIFTLEEI